MGREVVVAGTAGFCSGVRRAIQGVREKLQVNGQLYCLGDIIHNPDVIENLRRSGLVVADRIEDIPDRSRFVVRTHGLPKETLQNAAEKELTVFDFTCPKVKKIHNLVTKLSKDGHYILIVGNPHHPEVQAISSLIGSNQRILHCLEDVPSGSIPEPSTVVVQTTFNPDTYLEILNRIILQTKKTLVCNTLCGETLKRQQEARRIAGKTDFIVVVGGKHSSNTKTLFTQVTELVPAVHIENVEELQRDWFRHVKRVGVISGASTPAQEVDRVAGRIRGF